MLPTLSSNITSLRLHSGEQGTSGAPVPPPFAALQETQLRPLPVGSYSPTLNQGDSLLSQTSAPQALLIALQSRAVEMERAALINAALKRRADEALVANVLKAIANEERERNLLLLASMRVAANQSSNRPVSPLADDDNSLSHSISGQSTDSKTFPSERASLKVPETCTDPAQAARVYEVLGSTLRSKADKYVDVGALPNPGQHALKKKGRGAPTFFTESLLRMLSEAEENEHSDVVSFLPHGRAFLVADKDRFVNEVLPKYFEGQNKWGSFSRQLNIYGFSRVTQGPDTGAYYHELFLHGRPDLLRFMKRVGKPHGKDRRTFKLAEGEDPNFYAMGPIKSQT